MKTVTFDIANSDGSPRELGIVIVRLVAGTPGGVVDGQVRLDEVELQLDDQGYGELDLATNDVEVEDPTGTYYTATVKDSSPTVYRCFELTDDLPDTVAWTDEAIQLDDPAMPSTTVSSDRVRVGEESLTNYLAANITRRVAVFASDVDASGGSFTDVPLYESVEVPRAVLAGLPMLVVEGDDIGLWTITASGPCTAGAALAPGDVVASTSGRIAVAQTNDGTTVAGVLVAALVTSVSVALAEEAGARSAADTNEASTRAAADVAEAAARAAADAANTTAIAEGDVRTRLIAQAERTTPPDKWAIGGLEGSVWEADWQAPDPTSRFEIETLVRVDDAREDGFWEEVAESLDGLGDKDRFEKAKRRNAGEVTSYGEGTRDGDTVEYHRPGDDHTQLDGSAEAPCVDGVWVREVMAIDLDEHTITIAQEDDVMWDFQRRGRNWRTAAIYENPIITSVAQTEGHPTWIARGIGSFPVAEAAIYVDDVEVMHFDASTAEIGDTVIYDLVATDDNDDPIAWLGSGGAEVAGDASTSDGVPATRTISAGTGLSGGGNLSADRTLAVLYGLSASTAAEGVALPHATWRSGSYYGSATPTLVNLGQTVASGQVKATAFYNPVAGRSINELAVDVQSGSAGSGILYVFADDGTGYPGLVLASAAMSTPTTNTRSTGSTSATLPRGLLWLGVQGTGTTWSGLSLSGQSPYLPAPAAYSTGAINCWNATGAGTSTLTAFPSGASPASSGVQVLMRAA